MYINPLRYVFSAKHGLTSNSVAVIQQAGTPAHPDSGLTSLIHLINHTIFQRLRSGHLIVSVGVLTNFFHCLPRMVSDNLI